MSLRAFQDTTLIECARDARAAEAGINNMWRNDLAQSIHVRPGDTINVEAAMVQSGISDDQVEFVGPSDNKGSLEFAYYLANDWCFTAPLPLFDSKVKSGVSWHTWEDNKVRYKRTYGELDFTDDRNVPGVIRKVEDTLVNASKNLGPTYERFYIGDVFAGMYEPNMQYGTGSLLTARTEFNIPVGFHTPTELAQRLTDTLHRIGRTCVKADTANEFVTSFIDRENESLSKRYNVTDGTSKTFPTATGEVRALEDKFPDIVKTTEYFRKLTFYSHLGCTEPKRMQAITVLHTPISTMFSTYTATGQTGLLSSPGNLYTGYQFRDGSSPRDGMVADVGNFGLQIVVNDFLKTSYDQLAGYPEFIDCFPHYTLDELSSTTATYQYREETYTTNVGTLDLQDGDVIYTNLVANEYNIKKLQEALDLIKHPDEDGQMVAAIDLGRADDERCFSTRSTHMERVPLDDADEAEVGTFTLLSPPVAFNPNVLTSALSKQVYENIPTHYVRGTIDSSDTSNYRCGMSNVVLKKPAFGVKGDKDAYYTSSEVDTEWGYRVNVYAEDRPDAVFTETYLNQSYYAANQSAPGDFPSSASEVLGTSARLSRGKLYDWTWRHKHQGVDLNNDPLAPVYTAPATFPRVTGINDLVYTSGKAEWRWDNTNSGQQNVIYATGIQVEFKQPQQVTEFAMRSVAGKPWSFAIYASERPFYWQETQSGPVDTLNPATIHSLSAEHKMFYSWDQASPIMTAFDEESNTVFRISASKPHNPPTPPSGSPPAAVTGWTPPTKAYKYYFIHLRRIDPSQATSRYMSIDWLYFKAGPVEVTRRGTRQIGCMQRANDFALSVPSNMVVGYRSSVVTHHTGQSEPEAIKTLPFLGLIYKSQRVKHIPTPSMGEMLGISRSFSDLKCAKIISTQKDAQPGLKLINSVNTAVYNSVSTDYVPTVNVGAADAKFAYNETLNRVTLESLHTQMRIGQTQHNFNDDDGTIAANADGSLGLPGAPDLVQRLHFDTTVCKDSEYKVYNSVPPKPRGRSGVWALMSAQSGVGIVSVHNADGPVTHTSPTADWDNCLWAKLGYELEDLLPVYNNPQLLFNSTKYREATLGSLAHDKFVNQCSPLTTNGVVSTDQLVSLVTNQSGLPLFLAPGSVRSAGQASLEQVADYIIPQNPPGRFSYSHLVIYSDIIPHGSYIGCKKNSEIPAVGYITKSYVTGNYIYGQESPLVFTVERPYQISNILVDIRLPDGRPANLEPYSTVIFRVIKNRVAVDMTHEELNKIKRRRK